LVYKYSTTKQNLSRIYNKFIFQDLTPNRVSQNSLRRGRGMWNGWIIVPLQRYVKKTASCTGEGEKAHGVDGSVDRMNER
jgi:hypothetical protein